MDIDIEELIRIEKRIDTHEEQAADHNRESIRDRWESGKVMLADRKGKQLPKGRMAALVEATGKSQAELSWRMQFAQRYPTDDEVSNALETFTSWRQVIKSLPAPTPGKKPPTPTPAPKADNPAVVDAILDKEATGEKYSAVEVAEQLAAEGITVSRDTIERKRNALRAEANAAPVAWDTIPGNQREKLEATRRSIRKELEREYRTRLMAEVDQLKAEANAAVIAHKAKLDTEAEAGRAKRDASRDRYDMAVAAQRAKGLIPLADYKLILSCLHPDSRNSASDEKLAKAFRLFTDPKIEMLLVKE